MEELKTRLAHVETIVQSLGGTVLSLGASVATLDGSVKAFMGGLQELLPGLREMVMARSGDSTLMRLARQDIDKAHEKIREIEERTEQQLAEIGGKVSEIQGTIKRVTWLATIGFAIVQFLWALFKPVIMERLGMK